ncbi:MAG: GPP34 family phosphoprotein [Phycisphaerae bacterium]
MSSEPASMFLHEEIMLLALRDRKGTVPFGSMHGYALGGAVLAELLQARRITVVTERRQLVDQLNPHALGEPVLDECLRKIATAKRRASLQTWVERCARLKRLHHRVAMGLCRRGVLRADEKTVLLIFRRNVYPELDPVPERDLIERLRRAIFSDGGHVDPRTATLIALANAAELLQMAFERRALRQRKKRIKELSAGDLTGAATAEAVQTAQAAAITAAS